MASLTTACGALSGFWRTWLFETWTLDQALERMFGPPYQVGLDSGDQAWRWFYAQRDAGTELTKDLSVRFNPDGTVKAYAFSSNFPEDMKRLK